MISYYCQHCGKHITTTTTNVDYGYEIDLYPYDYGQIEIYRYWDVFNPDHGKTVCNSCIAPIKDLSYDAWAFKLWFCDNLYHAPKFEKEKISGLLKVVK